MKQKILPEVAITVSSQEIATAYTKRLQFLFSAHRSFFGSKGATTLMQTFRFVFPAYAGLRQMAANKEFQKFAAALVRDVPEFYFYVSSQDLTKAAILRAAFYHASGETSLDTAARKRAYKRFAIGYCEALDISIIERLCSVAFCEDATQALSDNVGFYNGELPDTFS